MDWITDEVAIGNYREAQDADLLKRHGFRSLLRLDGTLSEGQAAKYGLAEVAGYSFIDGAGNDLRLFRLAIADLDRLVASAAPVFVHCHAGRSRSVAVVAGYLMRQRGLDVRAAIAVVAERRQVNVTPELVELLVACEGE